MLAMRTARITPTIETAIALVTALHDKGPRENTCMHRWYVVFCRPHYTLEKITMGASTLRLTELSHGGG